MLLAVLSGRSGSVWSVGPGFSLWSDHGSRCLCQKTSHCYMFHGQICQGLELRNLVSVCCCIKRCYQRYFQSNAVKEFFFLILVSLLRLLIIKTYSLLRPPIFSPKYIISLYLCLALKTKLQLRPLVSSPYDDLSTRTSLN